MIDYVSNQRGFDALKEYVAVRWPSFDAESRDNEHYIRELLKERLSDYLLDPKEPMGLMQLTESLYERLGPRPWLEDLHGPFSMCRPDVTPAEVRDVEPMIESMLEEIEKLER